MSDELKKFYREIWAWIQDGCPAHPVFNEHRALCYALSNWGYDQYGCHDAAELLEIEQNAQFIKSGLHHNYPFNAGYSDWAGEVDNRTLYKNSARLAFIEEHAK